MEDPDTSSLFSQVEISILTSRPRADLYTITAALDRRGGKIFDEEHLIIINENIIRGNSLILRAEIVPPIDDPTRMASIIPFFYRITGLRITALVCQRVVDFPQQATYDADNPE